MLLGLNFIKKRLQHRCFPVKVTKFLITFILKKSPRSSHRRCSVTKGVLRNFAKFPGEDLCQSLFFNKVAGQACNFIKKESLAPPVNFAKFLRTPFYLSDSKENDHCRVPLW